MGGISREQITGMNFHYLHYPIEYFLDSMARYQFQNIELWGASPHFYVDDLSPADVRRMKRAIEQRGLKLVCFTPEQCMYPINLAAKEEYIRERSIRYFIRSLEVAAELEAPLLLVTPGWGYLSEPSEEAWKRSRDSLQRLAEQAGRLGIALVLEPLTPVESRLVCDLPSLKRMLAEVASPQLKGMIDTIPLALAEEELADYFRELQEDLVHIHFIDGAPEGHLAWGDGILPAQRYLQTLAECGYKGALTLEFTSFRYLDEPDLAIEKTLETLKPFLD